MVKKIAIIGMGYVGLPLAVEFGKKYSVIGYDVNPTRIEQLRDGEDSTNECTTAQLKSAKHLIYSNKLADVQSANVYIVTVPTPIDDAKRPNLNPLKEASKAVGSVLKKNDLVVYESTVFPGATREICIPILERESGLKLDIDFSCGYSPERINPGDKINTLTTITKITSGSNTSAANEVDQLYQSIITAGTWKAQSIEVAEAAKVIENSQRDLNIAFVNELSLIFDRLGIDTIEVLEAAGSKWNFLPFKPGLVGGHCIGVDPYYLTHKAEAVGYNPQVILAGRQINDSMPSYTASAIVKRMLKSGVDIAHSNVAILGITFKENCPDIRNSKVVELVRELQEWSINVNVVDPIADPDDVKNQYNIDLVETCDLKDISAIIVAVGHNQFRTMELDDFHSIFQNNTGIIADLKSLFNKRVLQAAGYITFRL